MEIFKDYVVSRTKEGAKVRLKKMVANCLWVLLIIALIILPSLVDLYSISRAQITNNNMEETMLASICKLIFNRSGGIGYRVKSVDTLWCKVYFYYNKSGKIEGILMTKSGVVDKSISLYFENIKNFYIGLPDLYILKVYEYYICRNNNLRKFINYSSITDVLILPGSVAYLLSFNDSIFVLNGCPSKLIIDVGGSIVPPVGSGQLDSFYSVINALDSRGYFIY